MTGSADAIPSANHSSHDNLIKATEVEGHAEGTMWHDHCRHREPPLSAPPAEARTTR
jgi:hypothetical protein